MHRRVRSNKWAPGSRPGPVGGQVPSDSAGTASQSAVRRELAGTDASALGDAGNANAGRLHGLTVTHALIETVGDTPQ